MRYLFFALLLGDLALAQTNDRRRYTSEVFSQEQSIRSQVDKAYWKSRVFFATPILGLRRVGYDSNVFSTEENEVADFFVSPEVGLETYYRPNPHFVWANSVDYSYLYYRDLDQLRGSEYRGESRLHGLFKHVYLDAGAVLDRHEDRVNSELDQRGFNESLAIDVNTVFQPVPRAHVKLGAVYRKHEFDQDGSVLDAGFGALEREDNELALTLLYKLKNQWWPFVEVERKTYDFTRENNPRDDSETTSVFGGLRNEFGRRTHVNIRAGYIRLKFPKSGNLDADLFSGRAFVDRGLTRLIRVELGGEQTPIFSTFDEYDYFISRRIFMSASYKTRRNLRLGPLLRVGQNDYDNPRAAAAVDRKDDLWEAGANLRFIHRRNFEISLSVSYQNRDSNVPGESDESYLITATMKPNFD